MGKKKGIIETISSPNGKRFYNVEKYLKDQWLICSKINKGDIQCSKLEDLDKLERIKICYARVSSIGQKDDLIRQKELLMEKYPNYKLIEDIG